MLRSINPQHHPILLRFNLFPFPNLSPTLHPFHFTVLHPSRCHPPCPSHIQIIPPLYSGSHFFRSAVLRFFVTVLVCALEEYPNLLLPCFISTFLSCYCGSWNAFSKRSEVVHCCDPDLFFLYLHPPGLPDSIDFLFMTHSTRARKGRWISFFLFYGPYWPHHRQSFHPSVWTGVWKVFNEKCRAAGTGQDC